MKPGILALDLDGTLITCEPRQSTVLRAVLKAAGVKQFDLAALWERKRQGMNTFDALRAGGLAEPAARDAAAAWYRTIEEDAWLLLDRPFAGVDEALRALRAAGHSLVLLTARRLAFSVRRQVHTLWPADRFSEIVAVSPSRAEDEKADQLRRCGAFAFVGDTERDAAAAGRAGVPFFAVASGQRSPEFLERHGVRPCFADFPAAAAHVLEMRRPGASESRPAATR